MSCFVKHCGNYHKKCQKEGKIVQFHRFPKCQDVSQEWIRLAGQNSSHFKTSSRICSNHFDCTDYVDLDNGILMSTAKPSKNLPRKYFQVLLFEMEIENMRVGKSKALYPFQKGILMTIRSVRALFNELRTGPLQIKYLFTARLNQDVAENAFSMLRSFGTFKHSMDPVDAKYRLRMLLLSWHLLTPQSTASVSTDPDFEEPEIISSKILRPLMEEATPEEFQIALPMSMEDELCELAFSPLPEITAENWENFNSSLAQHEEAEFGGLDYVAGFLCKKFGKLELDLNKMEAAKRKTPSWSQIVSEGHLEVPNYEWLNCVRHMDRYFIAFHKDDSDKKSKLDINRCPQVIKTLATRIHWDESELPYKVIEAFVRIRTFIRIKYLNHKLNFVKWQKKKARKNRMFARSGIPALQSAINTQDEAKEDSEIDSEGDLDV